MGEAGMGERALSAARPGGAGLDEFSADQLSWTLHWSRDTVHGYLCLAKNLVERLPVVFDALRVGHLDLPRARVFSEVLSLLDDDIAREIVDREVDDAGERTPAQLRERLRRKVIKAELLVVN